ncbi:hypothetical protein ACIQUB_16955 [Rhizobium sp. NPDC090275]|uniref:hypothetical protein n=1 Tax=Rhizobium sp. NPDC090275 TaxID=3364498 RepID=UPI003839D30A
MKAAAAARRAWGNSRDLIAFGHGIVLHHQRESRLVFYGRGKHHHSYWIVGDNW